MKATAANKKKVCARDLELIFVVFHVALIRLLICSLAGGRDQDAVQQRERQEEKEESWRHDSVN